MPGITEPFLHEISTVIVIMSRLKFKSIFFILVRLGFFLIYLKAHAMPFISSIKKN